MLDENLPTFFFKPTSDSPLKTFLYFTYHGSEPAAEYLFQRADPALPQSRNKYAAALGDATAQDVIFAEVLIEPEFQQPTLSAAEIRAQGNVLPPPVPLIPDGFTLQLYNPDQHVAVRGEKSSWTGRESWEFEMPQQSFRRPSTSRLDRQQSDDAAAGNLGPKTVFRWKRDGKFSRDMTCYMTGTSVGGKKSKDPDITVAMFKHGRDGRHSLTVYEPNLQRVDVEDRKGLEVVLLLGAEVIREIYLTPSRESFNVGPAPATAAAAAPASGRRKNSRPAPAQGGGPSPTPQAHMMTSAIGNAPPASTPGRPATTPPVAQRPASTPASSTQDQAAIEAETRRLRAMVEEEEERQRRRRDAAVAQETERLRREYGVEGQEFGGSGGGGGSSSRPHLPPRPSPGPGPAGPSRPPAQLQPQFQAPHRPSSVEPRPHAHLGSGLGRLFQGQGQAHGQPHKHGRRRGATSEGPGMLKKKSTLF